jgi:hypothetical protein
LGVVLVSALAFGLGAANAWAQTPSPDPAPVPPAPAPTPTPQPTETQSAEPSSGSTPQAQSSVVKRRAKPSKKRHREGAAHSVRMIHPSLAVTAPGAGWGERTLTLVSAQKITGVARVRGTQGTLLFFAIGMLAVVFTAVLFPRRLLHNLAARTRSGSSL